MNGLENYYHIVNGRKMKFGYTTGSCAAGAAKAAARMLLSGEKAAEAELMTPKGILLKLRILHAALGENEASCAVKKYAGDDPDMTDGLEIFARVERTASPGIKIDGGAGVGRVTKKGLEQPVGSAAINRVPREMIEKELKAVCAEYGYAGGLAVTLSIPGGEEIAKKTFNPRLGIVGGLSILGTSGIVEPMSEAALVRSIEVELRQKAVSGAEYMLVTPGNYGADFIKEHTDIPFAEAQTLKCSNFVGETIDRALENGVKGMLFVSHIGKFVKLAAGIMNTHSRNGDARAEIMAANALRAGISADGARKILSTATTDEALDVIGGEGLTEPFMKELTERILDSLNRRAYGRMLMGAVVFSNEHGYLGETENVSELKELLKKQADKGEN